MTTVYDDPYSEIEAAASLLDPQFGRKTLLTMTPRGYMAQLRTRWGKILAAPFYPFWVIAAGVFVLFWYLAYGCLWVLFAPIRIFFRRRTGKQEE